MASTSTTTTSASSSNTAVSATGNSNSSSDLLDTQAATDPEQPLNNDGTATTTVAADRSAPAEMDAGITQGSDGLTEALKAERRRSNQLEKELRGLRQQLTRFSEINPEEYARLQEAERQKQHLEQQLELRERQMEEATTKRVASVAAERDAANDRVQELRKERLLERAFSEAEGRTGGDGRGTFFQVFKGQLWDAFRLSSSKEGQDQLEPLDGQGQPLLGDDGRPMSTADFMDALRLHPVYGFLFQQRGAIGNTSLTSNAALTTGGGAAAGGFGEVLNPQAMSAAELYRAGFVMPERRGSQGRPAS
ncbi:hypothetical protein [Synechococcus sp. A15-44]|uniref:hypothetical protein n=1 Tax=Synechococcus sp. A15-44 TaxID=1050646 RepID=UPI00164945A0|nr:hypothetical protein [Synechococcus sp. A15-44]QNI63538.1 hypothetical protein SynA1544_00596 [Synechococcus sp. A15-44]